MGLEPFVLEAIHKGPKRSRFCFSTWSTRIRLIWDDTPPLTLPDPVKVADALEAELRGMSLLPPVVGPLAPMLNDG